MAASTPRTRCARSSPMPQARNITIVPEIEMPGHAPAAIVAYPELVRDRPRRPLRSSDWGVFPDLYNVDERTFAFLEDVLSEVMAPVSQPLHPCRRRRGGEGSVEGLADDPGADEGAGASRTRTRCRLVHPPHRALPGRARPPADRLGRDPGGGVPPRPTIMSWRGVDGALAAAKPGTTRCCPRADPLFRQPPERRPDEPPGRGDVIA